MSSWDQTIKKLQQQQGEAEESTEKTSPNPSFPRGIRARLLAYQDECRKKIELKNKEILEVGQLDETKKDAQTLFVSTSSAVVKPYPDLPAEVGKLNAELLGKLNGSVNNVMSSMTEEEVQEFLQESTLLHGEKKKRPKRRDSVGDEDEYDEDAEEARIEEEKQTKTRLAELLDKDNKGADSEPTKTLPFQSIRKRYFSSLQRLRPSVILSKLKDRKERKRQLKEELQKKEEYAALKKAWDDYEQAARDKPSWGQKSKDDQDFEANIEQAEDAVDDAWVGFAQEAAQIIQQDGGDDTSEDDLDFWIAEAKRLQQAKKDRQQYRKTKKQSEEDAYWRAEALKLRDEVRSGKRPNPAEIRKEEGANDEDFLSDPVRGYVSSKADPKGGPVKRLDLGMIQKFGGPNRTLGTAKSQEKEESAIAKGAFVAGTCGKSQRVSKTNSAVENLSLQGPNRTAFATEASLDLRGKTPEELEYIKNQKEREAKVELSRLLEQVSSDGSNNQPTTTITPFVAIRKRYISAVQKLKPIMAFDKLKKEPKDSSRTKELLKEEVRKKDKLHSLKKAWDSYEAAARDKPKFDNKTEQDLNDEENLQQAEDVVHDAWVGFADQAVQYYEEYYDSDAEDNDDLDFWIQEAKRLKQGKIERSKHRESMKQSEEEEYWREEAIKLRDAVRSGSGPNPNTFLGSAEADNDEAASNEKITGAEDGGGDRGGPAPGSKTRLTNKTEKELKQVKDQIERETKIQLSRLLEQVPADEAPCQHFTPSTPFVAVRKRYISAVQKLQPIFNKLEEEPKDMFTKERVRKEVRKKDELQSLKLAWDSYERAAQDKPKFDSKTEQDLADEEKLEQTEEMVHDAWVNFADQAVLYYDACDDNDDLAFWIQEAKRLKKGKIERAKHREFLKQTEEEEYWREEAVKLRDAVRNGSSPNPNAGLGTPADEIGMPSSGRLSRDKSQTGTDQDPRDPEAIPEKRFKDLMKLFKSAEDSERGTKVGCRDLERDRPLRRKRTGDGPESTLGFTLGDSHEDRAMALETTQAKALKEIRAKDALSRLLGAEPSDSKSDPTPSFASVKNRYLSAVENLQPCNLDHFTGEEKAIKIKEEMKKKTQFQSLVAAWVTYEDVAQDKPAAGGADEKSIAKLEDVVGGAWVDFADKAVHYYKDSGDGGEDDLDFWIKEAKRLKKSKKDRQRLRTAISLAKEDTYWHEEAEKLKDAFRKGASPSPHHEDTAPLLRSTQGKFMRPGMIRGDSFGEEHEGNIIVSEDTTEISPRLTSGKGKFMRPGMIRGGSISFSDDEIDIPECQEGREQSTEKARNELVKLLDTRSLSGESTSDLPFASLRDLYIETVAELKPSIRACDLDGVVENSHLVEDVAKKLKLKKVLEAWDTYEDLALDKPKGKYMSADQQVQEIETNDRLEQAEDEATDAWIEFTQEVAQRYRDVVETGKENDDDLDYWIEEAKRLKRGKQDRQRLRTAKKLAEEDSYWRKEAETLRESIRNGGDPNSVDNESFALEQLTSESTSKDDPDGQHSNTRNQRSSWINPSTSVSVQKPSKRKTKKEVRPKSKDSDSNSTDSASGVDSEDDDQLATSESHGQSRVRISSTAPVERGNKASRLRKSKSRDFDSDSDVSSSIDASEGQVATSEKQRPSWIKPSTTHSAVRQPEKLKARRSKSRDPDESASADTSEEETNIPTSVTQRSPSTNNSSQKLARKKSDDGSHTKKSRSRHSSSRYSDEDSVDSASWDSHDEEDQGASSEMAQGVSWMTPSTTALNQKTQRKGKKIGGRKTRSLTSNCQDSDSDASENSSNDASEVEDQTPTSRKQGASWMKPSTTVSSQKAPRMSKTNGEDTFPKSKSQESASKDSDSNAEDVASSGTSDDEEEQTSIPEKQGSSWMKPSATASSQKPSRRGNEQGEHKSRARKAKSRDSSSDSAESGSDNAALNGSSDESDVVSPGSGENGPSWLKPSKSRSSLKQQTRMKSKSRSKPEEKDSLDKEVNAKEAKLRKESKSPSLRSDRGVTNDGRVGLTAKPKAISDDEDSDEFITSSESDGLDENSGSVNSEVAGRENKARTKNSPGTDKSKGSSGYGEKGLSSRTKSSQYSNEADLQKETKRVSPTKFLKSPASSNQQQPEGSRRTRKSHGKRKDDDTSDDSSSVDSSSSDESTSDDSSSSKEYEKDSTPSLQDDPSSGATVPYEQGTQFSMDTPPSDFKGTTTDVSGMSLPKSVTDNRRLSEVSVDSNCPNSDNSSAGVKKTKRTTRTPHVENSDVHKSARVDPVEREEGIYTSDGKAAATKRIEASNDFDSWEGADRSFSTKVSDTLSSRKQRPAKASRKSRSPRKANQSETNSSDDSTSSSSSSSSSDSSSSEESSKKSAVSRKTLPSKKREKVPSSLKPSAKASRGHRLWSDGMASSASEAVPVTKAPGSKPDESIPGKEMDSISSDKSQSTSQDGGIDADNDNDSHSSNTKRKKEKKTKNEKKKESKKRSTKSKMKSPKDDDDSDASSSWKKSKLKDAPLPKVSRKPPDNAIWKNPLNRWTNKPKGGAKEEGTEIIMKIPAQTDCWRITRHNFILNNAPYYWHKVNGDFEAMVRITGTFHNIFDKAGLMVQLDDENWILTGMEHFNDRINHSTLTTSGHTDWSLAPLPKKAEKAGVWFCFKRLGNAYETFYSYDCRNWIQTRQGMFTDRPVVQVGIAGAAPVGNDLVVTFDNYRVKQL